MQVAAENQLVLVDYTIDSSGTATCAGNCRDRSDPLMIESDYPAFQEPDHTVRLRVSRTRNPKWGPELLNLRIARDQLVLHDHDYTPTYEYSEPFGEGCGEIGVSTILLDLTQ